MKKQAKRLALLVVGWAFILLGIAGLFLPVLQGILFLLIGLFILSSEYVWAHKLLHKLKQRFPRVAEQFERAQQRAEAWVTRISKPDGGPNTEDAEDTEVHREQRK